MSDDFDIIDMETQQGFNKEESFSHGQLVMISMRKCIDAGVKEMREGYYNEKSDKFGNVNRIYVPDTRKEFIEAVETCLMIMADDVEDDEDDNGKNVVQPMINSLKGKLLGKYKSYCKKEKDDWDNAHAVMKKHWITNGIIYREGMLHQQFPYYFEYLMEKVQIYRKIFAELKKVTSRKDYYKGEIFKA